MAAACPPLAEPGAAAGQLGLPADALPEHAENGDRREEARLAPAPKLETRSLRATRRLAALRP